ncbi:MAG: glycosyltransferase family 4 protein [Acidobacteria bacterium]|nr:glycosyltransferase family 4 protein [Acidobacteriota bacterium]
MTTPLVVVMVATSYPRFPGDSVGTFMEPIATSIAALGHEVHVVAPWHPLIRRPPVDRGVEFHFYRYAPLPALNVFGYAAAMHADTRLRGGAYIAAPLALASGWWMARRVARRYHASVMHAHWVVPGGVTAALAAPALPLVISLHGSDVFVAERFAPARRAARAVFRRAGFVTACSQDLAARAVHLGADPGRIKVVPYGVDTDRFRPDAAARSEHRSRIGVAGSALLVAAAGRLVSKKGFAYLVDAVAALPHAVLAVAGDGSLRDELQRRARTAGVHERVRFLGARTQDEVSALFAAADVIVTPSVRDDAGNVDGLPNVVMEALASGTALVTTTAGGIGAVVENGVTAVVVPERDPRSIAAAITLLGADEALRERLGRAARELVQRRFGWARTAEQLESAYRHALAFNSMGR